MTSDRLTDEEVRALLEKRGAKCRQTPGLVVPLIVEHPEVRALCAEVLEWREHSKKAGVWKQAGTTAVSIHPPLYPHIPLGPDREVPDGDGYWLSAHYGIISRWDEGSSMVWFGGGDEPVRPPELKPDGPWRRLLLEEKE